MCPTLTDDEMEEYKQSSGSSFFTAQNFRIDFKRGWKRCPFNAEARRFFIHHFLQSVAGMDVTIPSRYLTSHQVGLALDSHMEHARATWRNARKMMEETELVERAKLQAAVNKRKAQKQISSRQKSVCWRFIFCGGIHTDIYNQLLVTRRHVISIFGMREHAVLFSKLQPVHMSGDEAPSTEAERSNLYFIIEAEWQSEELKNFFRQLDEIYIQDWKNQTGNRKRGGRGPRRRIAKVTSKVVDSVAPIGLWQNCYHPAWLKKQSFLVRASLEIVPQDYKFTIKMGRTVSSADHADIQALMGDIMEDS